MDSILLLQKIEQAILSQGINNNSSNNEFAFRLIGKAVSEKIEPEDVYIFLNKYYDLSQSKFDELLNRITKYPAKKTEKKKKSPAEKTGDMEGYVLRNYCLRYNEVLQRTEIKGINDNTYTILTEFKENSLLRELLNNDIPISPNYLNKLLNSDFAAAYHPFRNYLNNLPPWDGVTDYLKLLSDTAVTTNGKFWGKCFTKFMVNLIASAVANDPNHQVLVLYGRQGIGKTTWLNKLIPKELRSYLFLGAINPSNKDSLIHLTEKLLINLDELENLNKTELNSLKSFITNPQISIRKVYGKNNENFPRRASIVASTNTKSFLRDVTGDRRYLCFEILSLDFKHELNMDMIYSQLYSMYKSGFEYVFNNEDQEEISENNEQYREHSTEEELILTYFKKPEPHDEVYYFSATEIVDDINIRNGSKIKLDDSSKMKAGRVLTALGYHEKKVGGVKKYEVTKKEYVIESHTMNENYDVSIINLPNRNAFQSFQGDDDDFLKDIERADFL